MHLHRRFIGLPAYSVPRAFPEFWNSVRRADTTFKLWPIFTSCAAEPGLTSSYRTRANQQFNRSLKGSVMGQSNWKTGVSRRLSRRLANAVLGIVPALRRVTGYFVSDDAFFNRRAVVATDQALVELRYHPYFGIQRALLIHLSFFDAGAFFSSDDGFRHAILADSSGTLKELFFRP